MYTLCFNHVKTSCHIVFNCINKIMSYLKGTYIFENKGYKNIK